MSLIQRLRGINPWHFVWICILLSELLSLAITWWLGLLGWWRISRDLLTIVAIEALVVPALVAPLVIYVIEHQGHRLAISNQALEREIAERRRVEQALQEREERYRTIFEKSGDAVFILDGEGDQPGRIVEANQAAADLHGFTMEELCSLTIAQLDTPESAVQAPERIRRILAGQWLKFEVEHIKKDGGTIPLEVTAGSFASGGRRYVMAFDRDISERRRAEEALRDSEEKFRKFADEASFDGIIVHDQGLILEVSQPFARMFGYRREELVGRAALDTVAPPYRDLVRDNIASGREAQFEVEGLRRDGSTFPMEVRAKNLLFRGQTVRTAAVRDITERKRAETDLRHSEGRYRSLVENVPYGLFICEVPSNRFLYVNDQLCAMTGYSHEESYNLTIWDLLTPGDHVRAKERLGHRLAGQRQTEIFVYSILHKDGSTFRCEVMASVVVYQGQKALQGFARDVTEQENLERQLLRAQKLEALGTLAGGVAHEFNNILMAIRGYTQLLAGRPGQDAQVRDYLRRIDEITRRAASLTSNMLGFARLESGEMGLVDLNQVLQGMASLLRQTLAPNIVLNLDTQADLPPVRANTSQLEQVLLNLALNASDAMSQGGTITFRSRGHLADREFLSRHPWAQAERYVELVVEDTGQGMPSEVLQHICEPFFTTKEPGKGTGLGLSVAFSIVKSHGGELVVESSPGQGSRFSVFLPAQERPASQPETPAREEPLPRGQGQRILVVDDEYSVREISREALEAFGYRVEEAADGQEALRRYAQARQAGQPFGLVILDLPMPQVDGRECLRRLVALDPGVRVMMATGHIDDLGELDDMAGHLAKLLRKPFDLGTLLREVGQVLAGPADGPLSPLRIKPSNN